MSDSPKKHVRGSVLPLVAMLVSLLVGDLIAVHYIDRDGLARYLAFGFLQAQAGLFCILGGTLGRSWISSFLQAASLAIISVLLCLAVLMSYIDNFAIAFEYMISIGGVFPPLLFCGCSPFLLMRSMNGGHLSRRTSELVEPYSLRMGDFFLAMTVIAALLAISSTVVGLSNEGEEFVFTEYIVTAVTAAVASAVAVLPVSIFYFRSTTRRGRIAVLFLFAILGLSTSGSFVIGFDLCRGVDLLDAIQRSAFTLLYLTTSTIVFSMGLIALYASGYRWRTIAKLSIPKESTDWLEDSNTVSTAIGYRMPNRIATGCIVVVCFAITLSVAHLKRERLRMVESHTKLNSSIVRQGGYVEQERFEVIALQLPQNSDCSNLDLNQFRGLYRISLSGTQINEPVLRSIGKRKSLRFVDLSHTSLDDSDVKNLKGRYFAGLSLAATQLSVSGINDIISGGLIVTLDIGELNLDDESISQLKLHAFKIKSRGLILRGNALTDKSLVHLNSIKELDLSDTKCTGSELDQLTQVNSLKLDETSVDDVAIAKLLSANSILTSLSLRNTQVTDETLKALSQHNNVTELELGAGEITAEGLIATAFAPSERLALNAPKFSGTIFANWKPRIRCLDMSHSGLSDADIHHLEHISTLQELSLAHCDVSDESIEKLAVLNLTKLDLMGTKVTATAVAKHFPKTTVVFLSPSQCSQEELDQSNKLESLRVGPSFDAKRY